MTLSRLRHGFEFRWAYRFVLTDPWSVAKLGLGQHTFVDRGEKWLFMMPWVVVT